MQKDLKYIAIQKELAEHRVPWRAALKLLTNANSFVQPMNMKEARSATDTVRYQNLELFWDMKYNAYETLSNKNFNFCMFLRTCISFLMKYTIRKRANRQLLSG